MSKGFNIVYKKLMVIAASIGLGLSGLTYAQSNYELGTVGAEDEVPFI